MMYHRSPPLHGPTAIASMCALQHVHTPSHGHDARVSYSVYTMPGYHCYWSLLQCTGWSIACLLIDPWCFVVVLGWPLHGLPLHAGISHGHVFSLLSSLSLLRCHHNQV